MDKLRIRQAIVVEGKYDQNALRQLVDTAIFTTNGFTGMKDPALLRLLRQAAQESVSAYPQHFEALNVRGALELLDENVSILTDESLYNEQTGLALQADSGVGIFL